MMSVSSKVFYLAGMACVIGAGFSHLLFLSSNFVLARVLALYAIFGSVAGLFGTLFFFIGQVGVINDAGLLGMLDWSMMGLLMDTNLGTGSIYRSVGFVAAIVIWMIVIYDCRDEKLSTANPIMVLLGTILLGSIFAWSITLTGHVSLLPVGERITLGLHLLAVMAWIGSLWPLRIACDSTDAKTLKTVMERFGFIAVLIVAVLLLAGMWLILQLFSQPSEFMTTTYGRVLLLKLSGVIGLFAIAARHKFILVPQLSQACDGLRLRRSIDIEILIAVLVVLATSILTSVTGPDIGH